MCKFLVSVSRDFTYTFLVDGVDRESAFAEYKNLEYRGVLNDAIVSIEAGVDGWRWMARGWGARASALRAAAA